MFRSGGRTARLLAAVAVAATAGTLVGTGTAAAASAMPATLINFAGIGAGSTGANGTPPDTTGAVGPDDYVQAVNDSIEIWDKSGTVLLTARSLKALWANYVGTNVGNSCSTRSDGDPIVRYDPLADRFVVMQFSIPNTGSNTGPSFECVAVSKTGDPTGPWWLYDFRFSYAINDYAKLGVWSDGYYITFNAYGGSSSGYPYQGVGACAWDRSKMLAGQPATQQCFTMPYDANNLQSQFFGVLPANVDGPVPPPAGSPEFLVGEDYSSGTVTSTALDVWQFHVDWADSTKSSLSAPTRVVVPSYTDACAAALAGACVPQPGSLVKLDSLGDRLMDRLVYRNFGTHESLVVSKTVDVSGVTGIGWWELRLPGGDPTLYQQGTYAPPDTNWRFMPSLALDQAGDMVLGFSLSSSSGGVAHPAIGWVGRLAGDPLGTMGFTEAVLDIGAANESDAYSGQNRGRWGDYSSMTVDPVDDCTFWYQNELYNTAGVMTWSTRIAAVKLPTCAANDFSVAAGTPSVSAVQGTGTTETVTTAPVKGSAETVDLSVNGLPAGATASFNPAWVTAGGSSTLTISTTAATPVGSFPVEVIGTAASAYHGTSFTLTVTADAAPTCADQSGVATAVNTQKSIVLACSDSNAGDTVTYAVATQPSHGTVSAPDADGNVTYTPDAGYAGADGFSFTGTDSHGAASSPATVSLTVGPDSDPVCQDVATPVGFNTASDVALDCTDVDTGQTLTYVVDSTPSHGTLGNVDAAGHVTYTPAQDSSGQDTFTYHATDGYGGTSVTRTVTLTVAPDSAPGCPDQSGVATGVNTAQQVVLACTDTDPGDTITYAVAGGPTHGTVTFTPPDTVDYTPAAGFAGQDHFTFTGTDNHGVTSPAATVTVTVGPDHPPVCTAKTVSVPHATRVTIALACTDVDTGQVLHRSIVTAPGHGALGAISSAGKVTYTPKVSYGGTDSFTFKATDGYGESSTTVKITLHVTAGKTALTLTAAAGKVKAGTADRLRARLQDLTTKAYLNGQRVSLQTRRGTSGSWTTLTSTLTARMNGVNGVAVFTVKPTHSAYYRVVFRGTAAYLASRCTPLHITAI